MKWTPKRRLIVSGFVLAGALGTVVARLRGYPIGTQTIVRCRQGHVFTTIWIPGASIKSLRLGWWRVQRCPVGHHWSIVAPVRPAELSWRERRFAQTHRDLPVP